MVTPPTIFTNRCLNSLKMLDAKLKSIHKSTAIYHRLFSIARLIEKEVRYEFQV